MNVTETLRTFTDFFCDRGHQLVPGGTLIPASGDPVLFTTSGMHPLTPYLEGRGHPQGRRLTSVQRCLRTTDIDEVGDQSHLTVFEMLGTWSLGDYPGTQSLRWGLELICDGFGISRKRLHATVFGGDGQLGEDRELRETWAELGVPVELTGEENWWSNGPTGLCGPDSELFIWTGTGPPQGTPSDDDRWMELWNHVMMRYRRLSDGSLQPLAQPNVDTGMGLERLLMIVQGKPSVFDCDVLEPWMTALAQLWSPGEHELRLLSDHLRASVVIIGDGVRPANTGRGYVLRRLIRRALTALWQDGSSRTLADLPAGLPERTMGHFGQEPGAAEIRRVLLDEERRFGELLSRGRTVLSRGRYEGGLSEQQLRYLHDTHGLPRELVAVLQSEPR
jgi:alanyl-tRNA synthetase